MYNYYPYDRNRYFMPFNPYNYYPISYYNYMKNQMAQNYQSIYNSGYMNDVSQNSYINQVGVGCTEPIPGEPPVPPV